MKRRIRISDLAEGIEVISVIGLEKNTGKTVVLNQMLKEFREKGTTAGVTSTGLEGEKRDQVYLNEKPEITLSRGTYFVTSERDFRHRSFSATVIDLRDYRSPLGRTVFARAEADGKVIISGPSILEYLSEAVNTMRSYGCEKILIDGSTSRMSPGTPLVSDGVILATGAALSMNLEELCRKTSFVVRLLSLPGTELELHKRIAPLGTGLWVEKDGVFERLSPSPLTAKSLKHELAGRTIYINGSLTCSVLLALAEKNTRIILKDFSRVFFDELTLAKYERAGGHLEVLHPTHLIAVTVNPLAPNGFKIQSDKLIKSLESKIDVPVLDVLEESSN
ncbi:hypothetical protein BG32_09050 [Mesotoga sp. HF07.pep.5.2.highcov]|uniref:lysine 5,6-aminomutase reactivase subunit KamB n=1 Tax=unclassified Mesotoga TaxID=1184398 RepID=UPI000C184BA1|nr:MULTISPECIES: hypothetical protein [unclassified Mesotoga]PIJ63666.1 hypothetical protein V513_00840 [Mesotoga sp. H07.pep.5.3]RLL92473.1 hypothetical protein BG32_09050 [Mesotoga sp. HF07.pep.5.2.highcov]